MLVDEKITNSVVDEDKKSSKEKFLKLKEKLLKPYVLLKKPEEALREFFVNRKSGKVVNTKINVKEKSIQQQQCNPIYVEMWGLEKYEPNNGILGILPPNSWQDDSGLLSLLRNTYGFRKAIMKETSVANNTSTFSNNELVLNCPDYNYLQSIINLHSIGWCGGLYIDEPYSNGAIHDLTLLKGILQILISNWKNKFSTCVTIGEPTIEKVDMFKDLVDIVNTSSYDNYLCLVCPDHYMFTNKDQRPVWTNGNNLFGSKYNSLWIGGNDWQDQGEMWQLLAHARNLNINEVWFYGLEGNYTQIWNGIYEFCFNAYLNSFLSRYNRLYLFEFSYCGGGNPCTDENENNWYLTNIISTDIIQQN